jgi:hypothetical protein
MRRPTEFLRASVSVGNNLRVDQPAIELSLHGDIFALGRCVHPIAAWTEVDQRSAATVLKNEKVSESLGYAAFHRDRIAFLHVADGRRLKQHDASWLPALCKPGAARAGGNADREHGEHATCEQTSVAFLQNEAPLRGRRRRGVLFTHNEAPVVCLFEWSIRNAAQPNLNRSVQVGLS